MAKELSFVERNLNFQAFTDELRARGPIPSEEMAREEKDWAKRHKKYAKQRLHKSVLMEEIRKLCNESPSLHRAQIADLLHQAQTGLDRARMVRKKAAMAKLQGK